MFDYLLFEKYGLDIKETNVAVIKQALENKKNADGWQQDLKQTNERKRKKAEESKKQWEKDCDILLDADKRQDYLNEFEENLLVLVEGVDEEGKEYIETFANSIGIDIDIATKLYEKYSSESLDKNSVDASNAIQLVMKISDIQKEYLKAQDLLKEAEINSLLEKGVSVESIGAVLDVDNCDSLNDILNSVSKVCDIVYELYNKQLLSPEFQKSFMEIFSKESKNEYALNKIFAEPDFEKYFKINNWILFKYIKATQLMMSRKIVKESTRIPSVPEDEILSFMKALNAVFGVKIPDSKASKTEEKFAPKISTKELDLGMKLLEQGSFDEAKKHLLLHTKIDPYEWKSYWGLFKCELKARKDNEIFFPGFLEQIRMSDMGQAVPYYVEYYKTARSKAYIVRTTEINFDNIEIEYKRADAAQKKYDTTHDVIKDAYENKKFEAIPSEKGRKIALQYAAVCQGYNDVLEKTVEKKYGIRFFIFAIGLIGSGIIALLFENGVQSSLLELITSVLAIFMFVGFVMIVWKIVPIFKIVAVILALGGAGAFLINSLDAATDANEIDVFCLKLIGVGLLSLLIGCFYIGKIIYFKKREETLLNEKTRLRKEITNSMVDDICLYSFSPENEYYHINMITRFEFDCRQYEYADLLNFNDFEIS